MTQRKVRATKAKPNKIPSPSALAARKERLRALYHAGQYQQASILARKLADALPTDDFAWLILTECQRQLGDFAAAAEAAAQLARLTPRQSWLCQLQGVLASELGEHAKAEDYHRQALALEPDQPEAQCNLARALVNLNHNEEAEAIYRQVLATDIANGHARHGLAVALMRRGQWSAALAEYRKAVALNPKHSALLNELGHLLIAVRDFAEARDWFRAVLLQDPDNASALYGLARAQHERGRLREAELAYEQVLQRHPQHAGAYCGLSFVYQQCDRIPEAHAALDKALSLHPNEASIVGQLAFFQAVAGLVEPVNTETPACRWERCLLSEPERAAAQAKTFRHAPRAGRQLRIGLLAAEFYQHPAACFLPTWMRALDRERFHLTCYPTRACEGALTDKFQSLADAWTPLVAMPDDAAAARIQTDGIDILIETTGYTPNSRLGIIARRAAPVQCHYIGYFATTGLSEMDYFIADAVLIPPDHDQYFTEQIWRLPRSRYAYEPFEEIPEPVWSPDPDGTVWLGTFNDLTKIREASLALWAKVLQALPEAKLLLKNLKFVDRGSRERVLAGLVTHGIAAERVEFLGGQPSWVEHMKQYQRLDVALDTIEFTSATTGFDTLWMGVPLVTLIGDYLSARQAASLLTGLGEPEWIAHDAEDYVAKVVALARDRARREQLRHSLRPRMRQGELCDGAGLARALEDAFDTMYARWEQAQGAA